MTLPAVIRIFFAIDLPIAVKEKVGAFIDTLKKKSISKAIRWTVPENLHITLQFLPEVRAEHVTQILDHVRVHRQNMSQPIIIHLESVHLFPSPYRPRVIVLTVTPQEALAVLAERIGCGIQAAHYTIEDRPFRAHLTLGRIKQPREVSLRFLSSGVVPEVGPIPVNEVVLFRSEPQREGSLYTPLARLML